MSRNFDDRAPLFAVLSGFFAASLCAQTPLLEQGRAALGRGDSAAAAEILEKAVAQSPASAEAHFSLANACGREARKAGMLGAGKWVSKMREELEKTIALDPKHADARFLLVQFYSAAPGIMGGSYEKVAEQAKEIRAIDPVAGHDAYAFIYAQQKKPELAKKEYVDAIREHPDSARAHGQFGDFLSAVEKDYTGAASELETALKLDPNDMTALYDLGRSTERSKTNLARGEEAFKKYLTYSPKENEPTLASAHYHLGAIYEIQGKKAEARQSYQTALNLNPALKQAAEALKRVS